MITEYLIELLGELRMPPRHRRRIVAEVEDHLTCAAAELHASGLDVAAAEREAIRRFGSAVDLARSFGEEQAVRSSRRLARTIAALATAVAALQFPAASALDSQPGFPGGVVSFVLAQVALVAGALTLVRSWRTTAAGARRDATLTLVLRGCAVVVACTAGILATDVIGVTAGTGASRLAWLSFGGLLVVVAVTATKLSRSWRHATALGLTRALGSREDLAADARATLALARTGLEHRSPGLAAALEHACAIAGRTAVGARRRAPRPASWLDLCAHPWRFAVTVSVLAGLAFGAGHVVADGGVPTFAALPRALAAGAVIATVEALAALAGFTMLGRYLGIRRDTETHRARLR